MKDVVRTSSGLWWREVETVEEAMRISELTQTAFAHYFRRDFSGVGDNRYFALGDDALVIGCVPRNPPPDMNRARPANGLPLFVGFRNGNPFTEHAAQIQELASAIGVEISFEHYPYGRASSNENSGPSP